jgi:hypothetical protein
MGGFAGVTSYPFTGVAYSDVTPPDSAVLLWDAPMDVGHLVIWCGLNARDNFASGNLTGTWRSR